MAVTGKPVEDYEREDHLITPEEARRYIEEDQQRRLQACRRELVPFLAQFRCRLTAEARLTADGRIVAEPQLEVIE